MREEMLIIAWLVAINLTARERTQDMPGQQDLARRGIVHHISPAHSHIPRDDHASLGGRIIRECLLLIEKPVKPARQAPQFGMK